MTPSIRQPRRSAVSDESVNARRSPGAGPEEEEGVEGEDEKCIQAHAYRGDGKDIRQAGGSSCDVKGLASLNLIMYIHCNIM